MQYYKIAALLVAGVLCLVLTRVLEADDLAEIALLVAMVAAWKAFT
jgi:hypothetical protein